MTKLIQALPVLQVTITKAKSVSQVQLIFLKNSKDTKLKHQKGKF
jgi:hypothetical protein